MAVLCEIRRSESESEREDFVPLVLINVYFTVFPARLGVNLRSACLQDVTVGVNASGCVPGATVGSSAGGPSCSDRWLAVRS